MVLISTGAAAQRHTRTYHFPAGYPAVRQERLDFRVIGVRSWRESASGARSQRRQRSTFGDIIDDIKHGRYGGQEDQVVEVEFESAPSGRLRAGGSRRLGFIGRGFRRVDSWLGGRLLRRRARGGGEAGVEGVERVQAAQKAEQRHGGTGYSMAEGEERATGGHDEHERSADGRQPRSLSSRSPVRHRQERDDRSRR